MDQEMDVEITFQNAGLLRHVVESIRELVTEVSLVISQRPERVTMEIMDCSHVSLVVLALESPSIRRFQIDWDNIGGDQVQLGVNLNYMAKVLKCANEEDDVHLSYNQGDPYVHIETRDRVNTRTFDMKCVHVHEDTVGIPQYPPGSTAYTITLSSEAFHRICHDFGDVSETLDIVVHDQSDKRGVSFSSTYSQELGGRQVLGPTETVRVVRHGPPGDGPLSLAFSTRFLMTFTKATPISENVELEMCGEFPLKVKYARHGVSLAYYLAPKIDDEA